MNVEALELRHIDGAERVVCVLTGHGLKDPDTAPGDMGDHTPVPATASAIRDALGG